MTAGTSSWTPATRTRWRSRPPRSAHGGKVVAIAGDVADPVHREALVAAATRAGWGGPAGEQRQHARPHTDARPGRLPARGAGGGVPTNVVAPLALVQQALPALLAAHGAIVNVTSDAAVEGYEGWGGYGSSKAALEQVSNVLAAEPRPPRVPVRSGRHAHPDAPGRLPGRGHLRSAGARVRRTGAAPVAGRRSAQRSLPGRRPAGGATVTTADIVERPAPHGRPGAAGLRPPARARSRSPRSPGPDPRRRPHDGRPPGLGHHRAQHVRAAARVPRTGRPRGREHVGTIPAASTPPRPTASGWSSTSRPSSPTSAGGRGAPAGRQRHRAGAPRRRRRRPRSTRMP